MVDVGGHRLHIWCTDPVEPGAPTVLFDSGLGGGAFSFPGLTSEISKFAQVCTYDRAGMGYSDPGPTPRTSSRIATELAALIENSDVSRPVILVGFSFSGYNTRMVASERPDLVAGMIQLTPSHEKHSEHKAAADLPSDTPPWILRKLGRLAAYVGILRILGVTLATPPERAHPDVREFVRATIYRANRYLAMEDELDAAGESGLQVAAARRPLNIPLVVLSPGKPGIRNEISRDLGEDLATLSSRSCHVIGKDSGHGFGGNPELVVKAVRDVLAAAGDETSKPGC